jgi:hypothetical protein
MAPICNTRQRTVIRFTFQATLSSNTSMMDLTRSILEIRIKEEEEEEEEAEAEAEAEEEEVAEEAHPHPTTTTMTTTEEEEEETARWLLQLNHQGHHLNLLLHHYCRPYDLSTTFGIGQEYNRTLVTAKLPSGMTPRRLSRP